jgi:hypothetical protein
MLIIVNRIAFIRIFWGLLFVVLDIRINSIDLILPDFIGYILVVTGLNFLAPQDRWFRRARVFAIIMTFVSITSLIEIRIDSKQAPKLKREWISNLTGTLTVLLPQQVGSARLLRTTSSRSVINANRTVNPERDEDRILGEYSDGTVVLILRYASSEEALSAMEQKAEAEYSAQGIRKRAETDESFRAQNISFPHGFSGSNETKFSAYSNVEVADRVVQQWWNRGWSWWNPISWRDKGGWGSSRVLYIVEGYRASADSYKSTFEGESQGGQEITVDPLFPLSVLGEIVNTLLIWGICSGIIALSLSSSNYGLMKIAQKRRALYMVLTVPGWALTILWFSPPVLMSNVFDSVPGVIHALVAITSVLLIMGLVKRAANSL